MKKKQLKSYKLKDPTSKFNSEVSPAKNRNHILASIISKKYRR